MRTVLLSLFVLFSVVAVSAQTVMETGWTDLFDRNSGWSGADGIYSVNLDGTIFEGIENRPNQRTFFVFSDTMIGDVDPQTKQRSSVKMPNHSFALLKGNEPQQDAIRFYYPEDRPRTSNLPFLPEKKGNWYWIGDCFVLGANLYVFLLELEKQGEGMFGFRQVGVDLLRLPIKEDEPDFKNAVIIRDSRTSPRLMSFSDGEPNVFLGGAVLEFFPTASAGLGDEFVYVYGFRDVRNPDLQRLLVAARFKPEEVENFGKWTYYEGNDEQGCAVWGNDLARVVGITGQVSPEMSLTPIFSGPQKGKFLLVYSPGTMSSKIAARIGDSPVGPFGEEQILFEETVTRGLKGKPFAYNAKGHPVLSRTGELLISFNVNSMDDEMLVFKDAEIYRPRFIRVSLDSLK
ncbi:MAG: hypothetical protein ACRC10_09755 [Thermoguttaceae bacterium]